MKIFSKRLNNSVLLFSLLLQPISVMALFNTDTGASSDKAISQQQSDPDYGDLPFWTLWNPSLYALADDGEAIWIGGVGSVLRWEKNTRHYQRILIPFISPNLVIGTVAVDTAGNRWFGSSDGVRRLDTQNQWTHFSSENSGLHSNSVRSIVVGEDNILWFSHGDDSISRRSSDGNWHWYQDRMAAVTNDYSDILQTKNATSLWAVAGSEVWVGVHAYDGSQWLDHSPTGVNYDLSSVVADAEGNIWALCSLVCDVAIWNGSEWSEHTFLFKDSNMYVTSLISAPGTDVWASGINVGPYGNPSEFLVKVTGEEEWESTAGNAIAALLPQSDGIWAVGRSWLYPVSGQAFIFADVPKYEFISDIVVDNNNLLWFQSFQPAVWQLGEMQVLNDNATALLEDDLWPPLWDSTTELSEIDGVDLARNGDLWISWTTRTRFPSSSSSIRRRHQAQWIDYSSAIENRYIRVTDIFAQDESHIWFAYRESDYGPTPIKGVLLLNDRGTATNLTDDTWTDYPMSKDGYGGSVVVDALGRIWFGNNTGLYRYDGSQWQAINPCTVYDIVATADGHIYAESSCDGAPSVVLAVAVDDFISQFTIEDLVKSRFATLRTAKRNHIWTVAPDGAIWYTKGDELHRRDAQGLRRFTTPTNQEGIDAIEVDANNHVWVVYQSSLWRMSAKPDFLLDPTFWLVAPGYTYSRSIRVGSIEGYRQIVELEVIGLSEDFEATLEPESVEAGNSFTLTLTVAPSTTLGVYSATMIGTSDGITHTSAITFSVVSQVFDIYLPLVVR